MLTELFQDNSWSWFAADLVLKATLLLVLATAAAVMLRSASAALRHRLWALSFGALLLLPLAGSMLPGLAWRVVPRDPRPAPLPAARTAEAAASVPAAAESHLLSEQDAMSRPSEVANGVHSQTTSMPRVPMPPVAQSAREPVSEDRPAVATTNLRISAHSLPWLWLAGAVVVLLPLATGMAGNLLLNFRGRRLVGTHWQGLLDALSERLALHRKVTLLVGAPEQMPMTFGWLRPCVVLPPEAENWPDDRREMVLMHELAHVKRFDVPWQIVARMACAFYWFHPLAWWAVRQMRLEREHACDDCVLSAGQLPSSYAAQLLEVARAHRRSSPLASAALSMARRSQLEGRLLAVLDAHRRRGPLGTVRSRALFASTAAVVLALGMVRPALRADAPAAGAAEPIGSAPSDSQTADANRLLRGTVLSPAGQPVAGARIEFIGMDDDGGWPRYRAVPKKIDYRQATTDQAGRFEITLGEPLTRHFSTMLWVFASADNLATRQDWLRHGPLPENLELKLSKARTLRVQFIDAIGNPIADLEPQLWQAYSSAEKQNLWLPDPDARALVKQWPTCPATDADGYTSLEITATVDHVKVLIDDERYGSQLIEIEPSEGPIAAVVQPGQFISGKVIAADTRKPLEGVLLRLLESPYRKVRTGADGRFRLPTAIPNVESFRTREIRVNVYPQADSPYLFQHVELKRAGDTTEIEMPIKLSRGALVEGVIREKATGRPVAGANVHMKQQQRNNVYYRRNSRPVYSGTDMTYATDAEGRFHIPVWFGPGYLFVTAPSFDFLHVMVSDGEQWDGKPGLGREYHDGALKINIKPGDAPEPLSIELLRGVTLRRKVVRPDGQPATCLAYSRSYLMGADIRGSMPPIPMRDGLLELPGFEPEGSNPLFLIDFESHSGATVSPDGSKLDLTSPPIKLRPCGAAKFRFLTDNGETLVDYEPRLQLIVTPGAPATLHIESDQPLWCDLFLWQNVTGPNKVPKTDAEGRVTVLDLIPGATYRLGYVSKQGGWTNGYEFTVRSGETIDVGDVVIPEHE